MEKISTFGWVEDAIGLLVTRVIQSQPSLSQSHTSRDSFSKCVSSEVYAHVFLSDK